MRIFLQATVVTIRIIHVAGFRNGGHVTQHGDAGVPAQSRHCSATAQDVTIAQRHNDRADPCSTTSQSSSLHGLIIQQKLLFSFI